MNRLETILVSAVIFIPDFIMLFATRDLIYTVTVLYFVVIFTILFLVLKFIKLYGVIILLLSILAILLLYLKTLFVKSQMISRYFFYLPDMPISRKLIFTVITLLILFFIIEGIFSKTFGKLLSYYLTASGMLLMQMATLAYMKMGNVAITTDSYFTSYSYVWLAEYSSIISLFEHGYQTYLPLYKLTLPFSIEISTGFAVSLIAAIFWLYASNSKSDDNTIGSFSVIPRLLIGFLFFISIRYVIPLEFEFIYIAIMVVAVFILISYSNKKAKDTYADIEGE